MSGNRFERWLENIYQTQDVEISCTECFDLISSYVDLELSGGDPAARMPKLLNHLHQCPTCREEYETLLDLSRLENEGGASSLDDLLGLIP